MQEQSELIWSRPGDGIQLFGFDIQFTGIKCLEDDKYQNENENHVSIMVLFYWGKIYW